MKYKCKICNREFNSKNGLHVHLNVIHNIKNKYNLINYYIKYDNLEIPKCPICGENCEISSVHNNKFFNCTCGNKECKSKFSSIKQKQHYKDHPEHIERARQNRIKYLTTKLSGKTAWERRANNEMSYLEQWFYDNVILCYELDKKYDIVNELPIYPYFIDFAFINEKIAVELDGKCHFINGINRHDHDNKKDEFLFSNGWKVFRISYNELNENTINEFLLFLGKPNKDKRLPSSVFYYRNGDKNIKNIIKQKHYKFGNKPYSEIKREYYINKIKELEKSNINFSKFGWVNHASKILNCKPNKVMSIISKYDIDFYKRCNCFIRNNSKLKDI